MMKSICFCFFLITIYSCSNRDNTDILIEENPIGDPIIHYIDDELKPYVSSFFTEMESRGLYLQNKKLTVILVDKISTPKGEGACGYGYTNFYGLGRARVEIINSENCWYQWGDIQKENLMYHELGHALLGKGHLNTFYPNGSPKSLMCGDGTCNNYRTYNKYQLVQKKYYLDQLINSQIPTPEWAIEKTFSKSLFNENFNDTQEGWKTSTLNNLTDPNPYTYFFSNNNIFSESTALAINSSEHTNSNAFGTWYKDFFINNFKSCSNIIVRSDIITSNLTDGTFGVIVDLYDNSNQIFDRYYKYITDNDAMGNVTYENYEVEVICIPQETKYIKVRFYLRTLAEASVHLDNLEIELYE